MKSIAFDGIVGDTCHLAEIDALGINRTQAIGVGGLQRGKANAAATSMLRIDISISFGLRHRTYKAHGI